MKKILVGYNDGIVPNSIVFEPDPLTDISKNKNCEVISYGIFSELEWHIRPELKQFSLFNTETDCWETFDDKSSFLERLEKFYPLDVEFFLFHLESLSGKLPDGIINHDRYSK